MIRVKERADGHKAMTASLYSGIGGISKGVSSSGTSQSISHLLGADVKASMLSGIIDEEERGVKSLQGIYRDIYHHDHLAGATVDLKAAVPWSDMTLIGMDDEKLDVFYENIDRLNMQSLHFEMSVDHLVTGAFIGMLVYNEQVSDKGFSDVMPFDYGDCEVLPVPLYSRDPIITLNISEEMQKFINDTSPDAEAIRRNMPPQMVENIKDAKAVDLDSLSTIYLPRATMSTVQTGVSLYRRILPIWLYERILYRGTLTDATRRQKSTLHIQVGSETWTPTDDELQNYMRTFQETEQDPISSYVATLNDVQTSEILPPGSDLRWTDMAQSMSEMKLMALGSSAAFLQGEANFSTQDIAISTFLESVATFRSYITHKFYYGKLFPLIAYFNDYYVDDKKKETSAFGSSKEARRLQALHVELNDSRKLEYPSIQWRKLLRPEANRDYLDTLQLLEERGVPIPVRMLAAVGGLDMEQLMKDMEGDKALRDKIKQLKPPPPPDPDGGGGGFASLEEGTVLPPARETAALSNILNRPYREEDREVFEFSRTGRKKWVVDQHRRGRQVNEKIAASMRRLSNPGHFESALRRGRVMGGAY